MAKPEEAMDLARISTMNPNHDLGWSPYLLLTLLALHLGGDTRHRILSSIITLIGITHCVASIIAIMTGIAVRQRIMEMNELHVQRRLSAHKAGGRFDSYAEWRKILKRKPVTVADVDAIRKLIDFMPGIQSMRNPSPLNLTRK